MGIITLRKHQTELLEFAHAQPRNLMGVLVQHEVGTGKTISFLTYARQVLGSYRARGIHAKFLVVVPKSATVTWQNECQKVTPEIYRDMVLLPYSQIHNSGGLIKYYDIRLACFDESHYLKSPETNRAEMTAQMFENLYLSKGRFEGGRVWLMTGTPMHNHAGDLYTSWAILSAPNIQESASRLRNKENYVKWMKNFANKKEVTWERRNGEVKRGSEYEGVANPELLQKLLAPIVHFRRAVDCIDLPEMVDIPIDLNLPDDKLLKDANIEEPEAYMAVLERLARAKTPYLIEWVKNFLDTTDKQLVVFAQYKFPVQELHEKNKNTMVLVTGEESSGERKANIEAFQRGAKRVIGLTYKAGSESLNLQCCHTAIYLGFPWTSALLTQAQARIHRQGQKERTLHYFLFSGYNDHRIRDIVRAKGDAIAEVNRRMLEVSEEQNIEIENRKLLITVDDLI